MNNRKRLVLTGFLIAGMIPVIAQENETKKIHMTTGVGINKIQGRLGKVFGSTVAFNSGFEKQLPKHWFAQFEVNFNSLKYDQQLKDNNSNFLFQNTNSSLFMVGLNGGKDFPFPNSKWFTSIYLGGGYVNIGEPRITIDDLNDIVNQSIVRKAGILGKAGSRIGINTGSKLFQTLYLDGSYLVSSLKTQGNRLNNISVFAGIRMAMN